MTTFNWDETYYGEDGRLYYKQESLLRAIIRSSTIVVIMMVVLLITHELGHVTGLILYDLKHEFFFFEPAIINGNDYGVSLGYIRWGLAPDFFGELYIKILGPALLNIITLIIIRILKKSLFYHSGVAFPIWVLIAVPALLFGDFLSLMHNIETGLYEAF